MYALMIAGRLYNVLATYYRINGDPSSAKKFCEAAISLAISTGNTKWYSQGLHNLGWVEWHLGDYSAAQVYTIEAQRLAPISANLYREAQALDIEAICCITLGNYTKAISLPDGGQFNGSQDYFKKRSYKALQFLGDIFLAQQDEHTATSLFTVALEGFTQMDVHHSRAECMLRFADISMGHSDPLKAVEFWERARPLFERSSQAKQVYGIDERLAGIREDVLEQHRKNLAHLAELNALAGTIEELEENLSDIEDLDTMDIGDEKEFGLIAA
ncbi:hypothetical protein B0H13DRAFT_1935364 [Mycena leptocephala]|nr:hypothetical protein B0H13DRAFT_1935364 [Mycena leptocephala]